MGQACVFPAAVLYVGWEPVNGKEEGPRVDAAGFQYRREFVSRSAISFLDDDAEQPRRRLGPARRRLETNPSGAGEVLAIAPNDRIASADDVLSALQLCTKHRARDVCQPVVVSNDREVVPPVRVHALAAQHPCPMLDFGVVDGQSTTFSARKNLVSVE